jgi:hypothetical protein
VVEKIDAGHDVILNPPRKPANPLQWAWICVGGILFIFAFNAMSASYHWPTTIPGLGFDKDTDRYAVALIATPVILILLIALAVAGLWYAREAPLAGLRERIVPPFGFGDPKAGWLQATHLTILFGFPLTAGISLFVKFLGGEFCLRGQVPGKGIACDVPGATLVGNFGLHFHFVSFGAAFAGRQYVYQGGPDYAPFWEPWSFVLLWIALVVATALWAKELLRTSPLRKG